MKQFELSSLDTCFVNISTFLVCVRVVAGLLPAPVCLPPAPRSPDPHSPSEGGRRLEEVTVQGRHQRGHGHQVPVPHPALQPRPCQSREDDTTCQEGFTHLFIVHRIHVNDV